MHTLKGDVITWSLFGHERRLALLSVPLGTLLRVIRTTPYDAATGRGEQRELVESHSRHLFREAEVGNYTPAPLAAGLSQAHLPNLRLDGGKFELDVDEKRPLPLTDGGHRVDMLGRALKEAYERLQGARGQDGYQRMNEELNAMVNLPVPLTLYLDGDTQRDFVNLQMGRPVDKAQLLSLRAQKFLKDPTLKLAWLTARRLDEQDGPFKGRIRFDTHSEGVGAMPVTTLCARTSSDLGTSLVGTATLAAKLGVKAPGDLASLVNACARAVEKHAPGASEPGKALTPPDRKGTKGAATMLVGIANCALWLLQGTKLGRPQAEKVGVAARSIDVPIQKAFPASFKRQLLGAYAHELFSDWPGAKTGGVPDGLLEALSHGSFNLTRPK